MLTNGYLAAPCCYSWRYAADHGACGTRCHAPQILHGRGSRALAGAAARAEDLPSSVIFRPTAGPTRSPVCTRRRARHGFFSRIINICAGGLLETFVHHLRAIWDGGELKIFASGKDSATCSTRPPTPSKLRILLRRFRPVPRFTLTS